jgi:2-keto-4-pentenoate hydratase/2-oxohepta-3-ene-1,7-dioic acid hydratase in catechol pathway
MKLATYRNKAGQERVGAVVGGDRNIVDLAAATKTLAGASSPHFANMLALIEGGEAALDLARAMAEKAPDSSVLPVVDVTLLAPLPRPTQVRDFLVFEQHVLNVFAQNARKGGPARTIDPIWYNRPIYYKCNRMAVAGHGAKVQWPAYSQRMDYELEIAWVIGKKGVNIPRDRALSHVFGFTIYNDLSARDTQWAEMPVGLGPAKGKDFDDSNVFGPWIVTTDEIGDYNNLTMVGRVNGEEWSRGNSGSAHHKVEDCIAFLSQSETLYPGEILGSGTVGTGSPGGEMDRWLQSGDVIEFEVERIGKLAVQVFGPSAKPLNG